MRRIRANPGGPSRLSFATMLSAIAMMPALAGASAIVLPPRRRVAAVLVRHLSDDLESAIAIGPGAFAGYSGVRGRTFVSPAIVSEAMRAIVASRPRDESGAFADVRWSVALLDARRVPLFVVYADRFVLDGAVGAAQVTFDRGAPLAAWLHAHDPLR